MHISKLAACMAFCVTLIGVAPESIRAQAADTVSVEGIEITQAIQNLGNEVYLIAGKSTWVRIYLSTTSASALDLTGTLSVESGNSAPPVVVTSDRHALIDPADNNSFGIRRADRSKSLNFPLPAGAISAAGRVYVMLRSAARGGQTPTPIACTNCADQKATATIVTAPPLRVRILGLRYQRGGKAFAPSDIDFQLIDSWLSRAYPISTLESSHDVLDSKDAWPFNCNQAILQAMAIRSTEISANRISPLTHYYALVSDANGEAFMRGCGQVPDPQYPADSTSVAAGPAGNPAHFSNFNWDTDESYADWYAGHELAHTFGRNHPGYCTGSGNTQDDPAYIQGNPLYRFPDPYLAHSDSERDLGGWDNGDPRHTEIEMRPLPGREWTDIMAYCRNQWLSRYTYEAIRQRLLDENAVVEPSDSVPNRPPALPAAAMGFLPTSNAQTPQTPTPAAQSKAINVETGNLLSVLASIDFASNSGSLQYVLPVERAVKTAMGANPSGTGPAVVFRIVTRNGNNLDYPCAVRRNAVREPEPTGSDAAPAPKEDGVAECTVPFEPTATKVSLLIDGKEVDFRPVTSRPPSVRVRTPPVPGPPDPNSGATPVPLVFTWDAKPQDGAKVTYTVQISGDSGKTWETLAVGLSGTSFAVPAEKYQGLSTLSLRVLANDGYRSTTAVSRTINIPK